MGRQANRLKKQRDGSTVAIARGSTLSAGSGKGGGGRAAYYSGAGGGAAAPGGGGSSGVGKGGNGGKGSVAAGSTDWVCWAKGCGKVCKHGVDCVCGRRAPGGTALGGGGKGHSAKGGAGGKGPGGGAPVPPCPTVSKRQRDQRPVAGDGSGRPGTWANKWFCQRCGILNYQNQATCGDCSYPRPIQADQVEKLVREKLDKQAKGKGKGKGGDGSDRPVRAVDHVEADGAQDEEEEDDMDDIGEAEDREKQITSVRNQISFRKRLLKDLVTGLGLDSTEDLRGNNEGKACYQRVGELEEELEELLEAKRDARPLGKKRADALREVRDFTRRAEANRTKAKEARLRIEKDMAIVVRVEADADRQEQRVQEAKDILEELDGTEDAEVAKADGDDPAETAPQHLGALARREGMSEDYLRAIAVELLVQDGMRDFLLGSNEKAVGAAGGGGQPAPAAPAPVPAAGEAPAPALRAAGVGPTGVPAATGNLPKPKTAGAPPPKAVGAPPATTGAAQVAMELSEAAGLPTSPGIAAAVAPASVTVEGEQPAKKQNTGKTA